tara:strand:- start:4169 stop:4516 length:348 start_codon:yes stop_codon:yes gene_type:complete
VNQRHDSSDARDERETSCQSTHSLDAEQIAAVISARKKKAAMDDLASSASKLVGLPLLLGGGGVAFYVILSDHEIGVAASCMIVFCMLMGGVLLREATFKSILERFIDAIPGGKN